MTSLYQTSIPLFIRYLRNLSAVLKKGEEHADKVGMKHEYMLDFRLYHDMQGLAYRVVSACNTGKFILPRLKLGEDVYFADDEMTFEQLHHRITSTIRLLETINAKKMDETASELVVFRPGAVETGFKFNSAAEYIFAHAVPSFHFHLTCAYCNLRVLGVPLDTMDYVGPDTYVLAN